MHFPQSRTKPLIAFITTICTGYLDTSLKLFFAPAQKPQCSIATYTYAYCEIISTNFSIQQRQHLQHLKTVASAGCLLLTASAFLSR